MFLVAVLTSTIRLILCCPHLRRIMSIYYLLSVKTKHNKFSLRFEGSIHF